MLRNRDTRECPDCGEHTVLDHCPKCKRKLTRDMTRHEDKDAFQQLFMHAWLPIEIPPTLTVAQFLEIQTNGACATDQ